MENEEIKVEEVQQEEIKVEEIKEEQPKTPKKGDKKKIIIIVVIILLLIAINAIVAIILIKNDKNKNNNTTTTTTTVTTTEKTVFKVTFNSNGGDTIESIEVKKDEKVTLPTPKKEGAKFLYWSDDEDTQYNQTTTFDKDTNLTANWKDNTAKSIKVTYDSKGGSTVSAVTYQCENDSVTIKSLPKNPTKDKYVFRAWEDKNGKAILAGAKLTCEDITLYAAYDQLPTCPDGYELGATDTICIKESNPVKTCADGLKYSEKANKCYKNTANPTITCISYQGYETGTKFDDNIGHKGCAYGSQDSYPTQQTCEAQQKNYVWNQYSPSPHCWSYVVMGESNFKYTCPDGTKYTGYSELGNTANNGCYTLADPTTNCEKGTLDTSKNKCVETTTPDFHNN